MRKVRTQRVAVSESSEKIVSLGSVNLKIKVSIASAPVSIKGFYNQAKTFR